MNHENIFRQQSFVFSSFLQNKNNMNKGTLVISLDYELMWGMFDVVSKDGYGRTNVANVPEAIERMVALFQKYGVHATFATVGMLMYKDKDELIADFPKDRPSYNKTTCSAYNGTIDSIQKDEEIQFFQPEVVQELKATEGIEIGTHTYCHYYCWEGGQTVEQFDADIRKACEVASRNGIELKSIIFPRNQVSPEHLKICAKYGITSYRGNAVKYFNEPQSKFEAYKNKICRLLDAYINIGGMSSVPYSEIDTEEEPKNLRASRMLRPYISKLAFLDGLRLRRMKTEMLHAARKGEMYHIWWHPHNFGANMDKNLAFLEELLKCYKECKEKYNMQSCTMTELAEQLFNNKNNHSY